MSTKTALTYFAKTLSKLDSLISTFEVRTGLTRELLKESGETSKITLNFSENPIPPKNEIQEEKPKEAPVKKAEKTKTKAEPKVEEEKQNNPLDEFAKLDIRVGKIVECWRVILKEILSLNVQN